MMRRAGLALLCCVGVALLAAFSIHHQPRVELSTVSVPSDVLNAMRNELAIDTRTITSLNTKVGKLDALVSPVHHPRRATALAATAGEQDKAKKSAHLQRAVNTADAKRKLMERQMDLLQGFKPWAANSALMDASRGKGQVGEWRPNRGPPYVAATTMFAGDGVDKTGSGDMIRRILGIKTSFRSHEWKGNNFITSFEGPQFRFLYRNTHSALVVPPLEHGGGPLLGWNAIHRLFLYVNSGHNVLIMLGGPASALFLNSNVINTDGGYDLEPAWTLGPYERQKGARGTPFAACATTLPGPGTQVHGVKISSLPSEAISYYEAEDVSVVFSIPSGEGRILYLGFDFTEPLVPWVHALIAATQFGEYNGV